MQPFNPSIAVAVHGPARQRHNVRALTAGILEGQREYLALHQEWPHHNGLRVLQHSVYPIHQLLWM